ncbi:MAG: diguanylate cyclase [Eubacteriales bacterium]|nr:diguanylate cyclase [Eubacteriales bacterium]
MKSIKMLKKRLKIGLAAAGICLCLCSRLVLGAEEADEQAVLLAEEEKEFVRGLGTLVVGCQGNADPVMYEDENGELGGITREILDLVAQRTGLQFEYRILPMGRVTYDDLLRENIDLVAGVEYNEVNAHAAGISLTVPYFEAGKVVVCRKETNFDPQESMTVAVASGSQTIEQVIHNKYPDFQVVFFDSIDEAMKAVDEGNVDCFIQNQYSVDRLIHKPKYEDLKIVAAAGIGDSHSLSPMINKTDTDGNGNMLNDPLLMEVLNKGIESLSEEEVSMIIIRQTSERGYELTTGDFLYKYRYSAAAVLVALAAVACLLVYVWRIGFLKRSVARLKEEEEKNRILLEKSEQMIYEVDLTQKEIRTSETFEKKFGWSPARSCSSMKLEEMLSIWRVHPDDQYSFGKAFRQSVETGQDSKLEVRLLKANGGSIWCRINHFVMMGANGKPKMVLGLIRDVNEETNEKQMLTEKSRRDSLTGLYNKEAFAEEVQKQLAEVRESGQDCAVVFVDLDNFKNVNDHLGHLTGDKAICDVAEILNRFFDKGEVTARFGGDEFCVFIRNESPAALQEKMQRLAELLCLRYTDGVDTVEISASIGTAVSGTSGYQWDMLLQHADAALYEAKAEGKKRCVFYLI